MKVCHFSYSFFPIVGGMEEVIHNLSLRQLLQGDEPTVFAPYVRRRSNKLDVPYSVLRFSRPSSKRYGLSQLLIPLIWHHLRRSFDVLHCHGVYPPGYVGMLFQRLTAVPLVITPHGGDIQGDESGCIVNQRITTRIQRTFAAALRVTAISSDMKRRILNLGAQTERVRVIPNGVDLDQFRPHAEYAVRTGRKRPYLFYIGSLIKRKGVDILLQAIADLKEDFPEILLKIAGDGKESNCLKKLVDELGLGDHVEFLGIVRDERKRELLQHAVMLICPSRAEPFGIVNAEALASGIPVIATAVGGIPDIVKDGKNGFLVKPEDAHALAEKISSLLVNDELRYQMAASALCSASEFDWSRATEQYRQVYMEICN